MYNKAYEKVRVLGVPFSVLATLFFISMFAIFVIEMGSMTISMFWVYGMAAFFLVVSHFIFKNKDDYYLKNRLRFFNTKGVYRR